MFGEGARIDRLVFQVLKVVTVCDHLPLFLSGEAEHEVGRKAVSISMNSLIENFGGNTVSFCKVAIYDYLLAANQQDSLLDLANFNQRLRFRHSASQRTTEGGHKL